jgi:hypothetical protein
MNILIKYRKELMLGAEVVDIDARYDFRPDRLAYEYYHQDLWFPAILVANSLGSMLQFKAESMNFQCLVPEATTIRSILGSNQPLMGLHQPEHILFKGN